MIELQQKIVEGGRTEALASQEQDLLTQLEERRKLKEML